MAKTPSLLSYQRSINPTDALFFSVTKKGVCRPVPLSNKTVLGTMSQYAKDGKPKIDANPQRVETASLPYEASDLKIVYNLSFCGAALQPHSCDTPEWRVALKDIAAAYAKADRFETLGRLYATNIANGRWAWKNRLFSTAFAIAVTIDDEEFQFDAFRHPMADFDAWGTDVGIQRLGSLIAAGLRGERLVRASITGVLDMGRGAIVFPSQEFDDKDDDDKKAIGKILFGLPVEDCERCAAFHEQKIGNAIRTIDIWHSGVQIAPGAAFVVEAGEPLPVNPYGQAREASVVVRAPNTPNSNLYSLFMTGITTLASTIASGQIDGNTHFLMANLVRGGVFGMKG